MYPLAFLFNIRSSEKSSSISLVLVRVLLLFHPCLPSLKLVRCSTAMRNMHWWIVSDHRVRFSVLGYPEFFLVFDGVFNTP